MRLAVKVPEFALPAAVLLLVVGPVEVPQQTPVAVTVAPPVELMVPPETAVALVMLLMAVVLRLGVTADAVKLISAP